MPGSRIFRHLGYIGTIMKSFAGYLNRAVAAVALLGAAGLMGLGPGAACAQGSDLVPPAPEQGGSPLGALLPQIGGGAAKSAKSGDPLDRDFADLKSSDPRMSGSARKAISCARGPVPARPAMDLLLERGRKAMQAGDYDAAIGHLSALIDHAPDFAEAYNARAEAYYRAGRLGPALADLGRVLTLNPRQFAAMSGLGMILADVDKPKDALAVFRMSLAIQPHQPQIEKAVKRLEAQAAGPEL